MYLLTPELTVVRTRAELELYVARTGAVIDSNTVNFSPPQQTALMDAELAALQADTESLPSRRNKKTPTKFSDFSPNKGSIFKKDEDSAATKKSPLGGESVTSSESASSHKCGQCDKTFPKESHLEEHMLLHLAEKPWPCDKCDEAFKLPDQLRRHAARCGQGVVSAQIFFPWLQIFLRRLFPGRGQVRLRGGAPDPAGPHGDGAVGGGGPQVRCL